MEGRKKGEKALSQNGTGTALVMTKRTLMIESRVRVMK